MLLDDQTQRAELGAKGSPRDPQHLTGLDLVPLDVTQDDVQQDSVHFEVNAPRDVPFPVVEQAGPSDLVGGDRVENREIAAAILHGQPGPRRDIVLVNAAAALLAAGLVRDLREGMHRAAQAVDSGAAWEKVEHLAAFTTARESPR